MEGCLAMLYGTCIAVFLVVNGGWLIVSAELNGLWPLVMPCCVLVSLALHLNHLVLPMSTLNTLVLCSY